MVEPSICAECLYYDAEPEGQRLMPGYGICKRLPPVTDKKSAPYCCEYFLGRWPLVKGIWIECGESKKREE